MNDLQGAPRALVTGARGLVGRGLCRELLTRGWRVWGTARSPATLAGVELIEADLCRAEGLAARIAPLGITHVFHAARFDHPEGQSENVEANTAMLRHAVDAAQAGGTLRHVHAVHGTKYYGHHLGPVPLPLREDESPRHTGENYYFTQQDLLERLSGPGGWSWTTSRPHAFCDLAIDEPRSLGLVFAVFAAVQKELGLPFAFPGSAQAYESRTQFTDQGLLSRAISWMATEPRCANLAFNVVNGDNPTWRELWAALAPFFGMAAGEAMDVKLVDYMADKEPVWQALVRRHGLRPSRLRDVALWGYGDIQPRPRWDVVSSVERARQLGFGESVDSTAMFLAQFRHYREQHVIP